MIRPWRLEIKADLNGEPDENGAWNYWGSYATKQNAEKARDENWGLAPENYWRIRARDGWQA